MSFGGALHAVGDFYTMDIYDADIVPIVVWQPVIFGADLLRQYRGRPSARRDNRGSRHGWRV